MEDFGLNDDGTSLFDIGLGGGYFDYPGGDSSGGGFGPTNPFGPDSSFDYSHLFDGSYDPSGGSIVPGTGGADLAVPSDPTGGDGGGGGSSIANMIMHALGLKNMDSGGLGQILMAALGIGGGLFNRTNTQHATDQAVGALRDANNQITGILGGGNTAFRPYADLGAYAAQGLQNLPLTPIAGNFNSLGTGRGIKLGALSGH